MATVKLKRFSDDAIIDVDLHKLLDSISKRRVNTIDDSIFIDDETYVFSSLQFNVADINPVDGDCRLHKDGSTIYLQYYSAENWIDTGTSWDI